MIAEIAALLLQTTLATSGAILLVLALRRPLMARLGASAAHAAWALVPVAWLAVLLPAPKVPMAQMTALSVRIGESVPLPGMGAGPAISWSSALIVIWMLGAIVFSVLLWSQQRLFRHALEGARLRKDGLHQASVTHGLPAVVGVLRPRIVLPADFDTRYTEDERELILCHERIHIHRRDLQANAIAAVLLALYWFNPLMHHAVRRFRHDQELACDERVMARHPGQRRRYADAMLKTHVADTPLPIGCHWQASNPLKERIEMLKQHAPGKMRSLIGIALVSLLLLAGGFTAWATQPAQTATPSDTVYSVKLKLDVDGEVRDFEIREYAGRPFAFATTTQAGREWKGEFKVDGLDANKVVLSGTLSENGQQVSSPTLIVETGKAAGIHVGNLDGSSLFKLEAVITPLEPGIRPATLPLTRFNDALDTSTASRMPPPRYPTDAAREGISGRVILLVDVAPDGSVMHAEIEKSQPAGVFDAATLDVVKQWKFNPAFENGKPVASRVRVPVDFQADEYPQGSEGLKTEQAG